MTNDENPGRMVDETAGPSVNPLGSRPDSTPRMVNVDESSYGIAVNQQEAWMPSPEELAAARSSNTFQESALSRAAPPEVVSAAVGIVVHACHGLMVKLGWWADPVTKVDARANPLCFSSKLALVHSEVSEALEGDRKDLMDTHLPHRKSREVELADAVIRICDLAGAYDLDLGGALVEKLAYNAARADHKVANRLLEGGKAY